MMSDGNRAGSAVGFGFGYPWDPADVQSLIVTPGGNAIVSLVELPNFEHVRRRLLEHQVAFVLQLRPVIGRQDR